MPELPAFVQDAPPVKPEQAIKFWTSRTPLADTELKTLDAGTRDRAFVVAGLSKHDQVALVHTALHDALENGTTLADFKKQIAPLMAKHGWTSHRIETIFRTNMQTAYAAGRWAQIQSVKKYRPYLEYFTVGDSRVRPNHAVLSGMIFPADHEFWDANYPPNGYACRCGARTVSRHEVDRRGLTVQTEMPSNLLYTDPHTGMEYHVAMPGADRGFGNNPGKDWLAGLAPAQVESRYGSGKPSGVLLCRSSKDFSSVEEGSACFVSMADIPEKHIIKVTSKDLLPGNLTQMAYINAFLGEFGIKYGQSKLFRLPGVSLPLVINEKLFLDKQTNKFKVIKGGRERYLKLLAQTIKNPFEIWMHPTRLPNGRQASTLSLIRLFMLEGDDRRVGGLGIFRLYNGREWSGSTVFAPNADLSEREIFKYLDEMRLSALLEHGNAALVYREK